MAREGRNTTQQTRMHDYMAEDRQSTIPGDRSPESLTGGGSIRTRITFPATIRKNGNSFYITVPGQYLAKMGLGEDDDVDITVARPSDTDDMGES